MPTCPKGHVSATTDYCEVCGSPLQHFEPGEPAASSPSGVEPEACPRCGRPRVGRFCEEDGYDFEASSGGEWTAVVGADEEYFERVTKGRLTRGLEAIPFPDGPERRITLGGQRVRIGRRSESRVFTPEIDLSVPPDDAAVSHRHAELLVQSDGSWELVDRGSTNGTYLNGEGKRLPVDVPVRLAHGDWIHLGFWTRIAFHQRVGSHPQLDA